MKLSSYDNSGKLVSVILNDVRSAGYYTVNFNGSNLSSGIYFYRIETNGQTIVLKMSLIK